MKAVTTWIGIEVRVRESVRVETIEASLGDQPVEVMVCVPAR